MAGMLVVPQSEVPLAIIPALIRDISTSKQTLTYPSGAKSLTIMYKLLPGAIATTNQFVKIVINASSSSDADGKLAVDGSNIVLCHGDDLVLFATDNSPITRVDLVASVAVGTEKTLLQILAGV